MILSDCIKIKNVENISTEYVEEELKKQGIFPLRWAISGMDDTTLTISLAYEREKNGRNNDEM